MKQPLRHRLSKSRIPRTFRSSIYRCQISMSICAGVSLTSSACDRSICPSESSRQPKNLLLERCGSIRTAPGHLIERGGSFGKIRQGSRWVRFPGAPVIRAVASLGIAIELSDGGPRTRHLSTGSGGITPPRRCRRCEPSRNRKMLWGRATEEMATSWLYLTMECRDAPAERPEQKPTQERHGSTANSAAFGGPGAAVGTTPVPGATAEDRGPGPKIPTKRLERLYHCPCPR
jgi:hypothetical protein